MSNIFFLLGKINSIKILPAIIIVVHLLLLFLVEGLLQLFPENELINTSAEFLIKEGHFVYILYGVLLIPAVETLIFQFLIIEIIYLLNVRKSFKIIGSLVFSALMFSLVHNFSLFYLIAAFLAGLVFASSYICGKNTTISAFFYPFFIHLAWNLFGYIIDYL